MSLEKQYEVLGLLEKYSLKTKGHTDFDFMDYDIINYLQTLMTEIDCSPPNTDQLNRKISSVVIFYEEDEGGRKDMSETEKTYCCPDCQSDDILFSNWTDENMVVSGKLEPPVDSIICWSCGSQFSDPEEKEEV